MMARFVTVHVVAHQPLFVYIFRMFKIFGRQVHRKERVETTHKPFLSAHQTHQSVDIVRYEERIVPRIAFDKALSVGIEQVKIFFERPVLMFRAGKTQQRIKNIAITACTFRIFFLYIQNLHPLSQLTDRPIVVTVFKRDRSCRTAAFERYITQLLIFGNTIVVIQIRTVYTSIQCKFFIHR